MSSDFEVTVHGERGEEFKQIFGTNTVYIKSFIPQVATLPIGEREVYFMDLDLLTTDQRQRLYEHTAKKFNAPLSDVIYHLNTRGLPILAEDCVVTIRNPQKWID